jgi:hypothetical protein
MAILCYDPTFCGKPERCQMEFTIELSMKRKAYATQVCCGSSYTNAELQTLCQIKLLSSELNP